MKQPHTNHYKQDKIHATYRRNTIMVWSLLIITLAAWNIYNIEQHESANTINNIEILSLQGDVLKRWGSIHREEAKSPSSYSKTYEIDENRTLKLTSDRAFTLETVLGEKTSISIWKIFQQTPSRISPGEITRHPSSSAGHDSSRRSVTKTFNTAYNCASCHSNQQMGYSVSMTEDNEHKIHEIIGLAIGYLLLLTLGILFSNINHNKLVRNTQVKRIYEEKLQEQYESQKAISSILELAISNATFSDKLRHVLDIVTGVSWLKITSKGMIFSTDSNNLVISATKGIPQTVSHVCKKVALGECLCGQAANKKSIQYTPHINSKCTDIICKHEPHGHYCIPLIHEESLLGLLTLLVEEDHQESQDEIKFLTTVGNSLGSMMYKVNMEEQLRYDAYHDQLTGTANRALLAERVNSCIKRSPRESKQDFCLIYLDLDRFKCINDSLGHYIGDSILVETTRRLKHLLRECDTLARLGGDEFVILLDDIESLNTVYHIARRIHESLDKNIHIESYDLHTTCSIGIAYSNDSYDSFEQILRDADIAMYMAKSSSTDKTITFDHKMHMAALHTLSIESALRFAGEQRELIAYFQPIYSTSKERFIGAEALVRWNRGGKITPPSEFIGIAEDSGIIIMLGEYVLHEACKMITRLSRVYNHNDFYISVNVSAKQMLNRNLIEMLDRTLEQHATPTRHLRLEITESLFADNSPLVSEHLNEIKARGIKLLIDDFGTGYSSLSFLHNHPFDCVKIDRSFISKISTENTSERSKKLIKTITELATNLNMSVVAEGVENEVQMSYMREIGCDLIQGYLFSEPLAPENFFHAYTTQSQPCHLLENH